VVIKLSDDDPLRMSRCVSQKTCDPGGKISTSMTPRSVSKPSKRFLEVYLFFQKSGFISRGAYSRSTEADACLTYYA
jgi:hypothetical protein